MIHVQKKLGYTWKLYASFTIITSNSESGNSGNFPSFSSLPHAPAKLELRTTTFRNKKNILKNDQLK